MKKITTKILILAVFMISFSSCLKQGDMNIDTTKGNNVIEFNNTGGAVTVSGVPGFYLDLGVLGAGGKKSFNINIHYAGSGVAPEDITVKLAINQALLTTYNTDNETEKVVPPTSVFTFPAEVVIKKGTTQTTVSAGITISNDFDFQSAYALPIKITSVSSGIISGNYGGVVYSFGVRNKYDGVFTLKGRHTRPPYTFPYETTIEMRTLGATAVGFYWPDAESFGHPIGVGAGNSMSWYGSGISPVAVFDAATDKVTSFFNQGGATPIGIYTGPGSGESRQDPATKTMYLYWRYNNNDLRAFVDTLIYVGPR